ncbi:redox-regulated ATPase YchF [Candidatus Poriferisodalis sp.]|uniref:redox-regulated ATPase YchF n=1 Tax=Candidatus Poriferisodalis sp. TaxID=3101277 RepID=UPI003B5BCCDD
MERFGFVGLPNAGKSSLFNSLAGGGALAAPYAFATTDPNVGVARVPDGRLDALARMSASRKVVPTTTAFIDIGGLVEGASKGEGLGNRFLAGIRDVDAIVFVLRAFTDADVPGPADPLEHLSIVETELTLADLESVESRINRRRKALRSQPSDTALAEEVAALEAALEHLEAGTPLFRAWPLAATCNGADEHPHRVALRSHFLLTDKPVMAVLNIGEDQLDAAAELAAPIEAELPGATVLPLCVQLEAEAAQLEAAGRAELLEGLGLGSGALERFVAGAHGLLGLRTFLTTGEKESRAWTFRAGWRAPQCAGRIHTDFERGFIRAEVIDWAELLELGSWGAAREAGRMRVEGKDYPMRDGDVVEFRFNV